MQLRRSHHLPARRPAGLGWASSASASGGPRRRRRDQRGASLVEVLVAVALLSMTLHALVAAHAAALRYTQMSHYRATALLLAAELGERMRANLGRAGGAPMSGASGGASGGEPDGEGEDAASETGGAPGGEGADPVLLLPATGFHAGDYDYTLDFHRQQGVVDGPALSCAQAGSVCTAAQMAAADLAQWRQAVRRLLPAGAVYAQRDTARAVMDLWVAWREPAPGPSDDPDPAEAQWVPPGECPEGLGRGDDLGIRCVHLRIGL